MKVTSVMRTAPGTSCSKCGSKYVGIVDYMRKIGKCIQCDFVGVATNDGKKIVEVKDDQKETAKA